MGRYVHMYIAVSPKRCILEFVSYLKVKSTLMLFGGHPEYWTKWGRQTFLVSVKILAFR